MPDDGNAYVARKPCGCIVAAIALSMSPGEISKALADWTKRGLTIEQVPAEVVRREFVGHRCPHLNLPPQDKPTQLSLLPDDKPAQRKLL